MTVALRETCLDPRDEPEDDVENVFRLTISIGSWRQSLAPPSSSGSSRGSNHGPTCSTCVDTWHHHDTTKPRARARLGDGSGRCPIKMGMGRRHCISGMCVRRFHLPDCSKVSGSSGPTGASLGLSLPDDPLELTALEPPLHYHHRTPDANLGVTGSRTRLPVR